MNRAGTTQGTFDFDSDAPGGYDAWRRDQQARLDAIRREWALPIGRRVRIRLRDIDGEFEGKLELAGHPETIDRRAPLHLRIGRVDMCSSDIEQCVVIPSSAPPYAAHRYSHCKSRRTDA